MTDTRPAHPDSDTDAALLGRCDGCIAEAVNLWQHPTEIWAVVLCGHHSHTDAPKLTAQGWHHLIDRTTW